MSVCVCDHACVRDCVYIVYACVDDCGIVSVCARVHDIVYLHDIVHMSVRAQCYER